MKSFLYIYFKDIINTDTALRTMPTHAERTVTKRLSHLTDGMTKMTQRVTKVVFISSKFTCSLQFRQKKGD